MRVKGAKRAMGKMTGKIAKFVKCDYNQLPEDAKKVELHLGEDGSIYFVDSAKVPVLDVRDMRGSEYITKISFENFI